MARDADGTLQRLDALTQKDGSYQIRYLAVLDEVSRAMCSDGISISIIPKAQSAIKKSGDLSKVDQLSVVPDHFSIVGYNYGGAYGTYGNFWVPATMPSNHTAHITQFDVAENGFYNATNGAHLVHMLTASSSATIDTEYQGKGMIFGPYGYFCGPGSAGASSPGGGS